MSRSIYTAPVGAAVALVAATPKTVLSMIAPAQFGVDLTKFRVGFDGVTSSDKAVLIELVRYTSDGNGTAGTVALASGRVTTAGFTTKYNYTAEPTGAAVVDRWTLTPIGGLVIVEFGDDSPDTNVSELFGLRLTAPTSAVNVNATMWAGRA